MYSSHATSADTPSHNYPDGDEFSVESGINRDGTPGGVGYTRNELRLYDGEIEGRGNYGGLDGRLDKKKSFGFTRMAFRAV